MRQLILLLAVLSACNRGGEEAQPPVPDVVYDPLSLDLQSPAGTDFINAPLAVSGLATGGQAFSLRLNDVEISATDGAFSVSTDHGALNWPTSPLWPVLVHAEDETGWLRARRTLIYGAGVSAGTPMDDALTLRLTDKLLTDLKPVLLDQIAGLDLSGIVPADAGPLTSVDTVIFGTYDIYLDAVSYQSIEITTLDFTPSGLQWGGAVIGLSADIRVNGTAGVVSMESVEVSGVVTIGVESGALTVVPGGTTVNPIGTSVTLFDDVRDPLIAGAISSFVGPYVSDIIEQTMIDGLSSVLGFQDSVRTLAFGELTIQSDFTSSLHDVDGVSIWATSQVLRNDTPLSTLRLSNPGDKPYPMGAAVFNQVGYGVGILLDDDLISALGVGVFESGLLEQEVSGQVGGIALNSTLLSAMIPPFSQLPDGTEMTIKVSSQVAPPASPGTKEGEAARFNVGGLVLDFYGDQDGDGVDELVMTLMVDVVLGIGSGVQLLDLEIIQSQVTLLSTVLDVADINEVETRVDGLLAVLLPSVVGPLLDNTGALDVLNVVTTGPAGPSGDRAGLYGDLDFTSLLPAPLP